MFAGTKDYTAKQVQELLGLSVARGPRSPAPTGEVPDVSRFLRPVSECEFPLETILEDLKRDPVRNALGRWAPPPHALTGAARRTVAS